MAETHSKPESQKKQLSLAFFNELPTKVQQASQSGKSLDEIYRELSTSLEIFWRDQMGHQTPVPERFKDVLAKVIQHSFPNFKVSEVVATQRVQVQQQLSTTGSAVQAPVSTPPVQALQPAQAPEQVAYDPELSYEWQRRNFEKLAQLSYSAPRYAQTRHLYGVYERIADPRYRGDFFQEVFRIYPDADISARLDAKLQTSLPYTPEKMIRFIAEPNLLEYIYRAIADLYENGLATNYDLNHIDPEYDGRQVGVATLSLVSKSDVKKEYANIVETLRDEFAITDLAGLPNIGKARYGLRDVLSKQGALDGNIADMYLDIALVNMQVLLDALRKKIVIQSLDKRWSIAPGRVLKCYDRPHGKLEDICLTDTAS